MSVKISNDGIEQLKNEVIQRDLKRIQQSDQTSDNGGIASDDKVELSSKALDLKAKAMAISDVRPEKVEQIKMQLDNGTYQISSEKIAERLIEESLEIMA